jgi:hypothetical protein
LSSNTYIVRDAWKKSKTGYADENGILYNNRKTARLYEYGNPYPIDQWYEYKNRITTVEEEISNLRPRIETGIGEGQALSFGSDTGLSPDQYVSPSGDTGIYDNPFGSQLSPLEQALMNAYTEYLETVTYNNRKLREQLTDQYEISGIVYDMTEEEIEQTIERDYMLHALPRLDYETWKLKSRNGTLPELAYVPPTNEEEMDVLDEILNNEGLNKFYKGMQYGWEVANSTGLTRIIAMGLAGMPDTLVKSMAISTQIQGNMERLMGKQDALTRTVGTLVSKGGIATGTITDYKPLYEQLNEQAQRRGIIKGNWTLRLSRNIPLNERYKRLYYTLKAYIQEHQ